MEPVLDVSARDTWPAPLDRTPEQILAILAYEKTEKMPYKYQVEVALALKSGRDVVCIAGTGAGKSMAFILPLFLGSKTIVWIVSPLNFIENQMAKNYQKFGLSAVAVNASTITPELILDIKKGKYQVVISSPEAYKDTNKLRGAPLSKELSSWQHITVVDEAHVIHTWANTCIEASSLESGFP
ncbi:hypothetical protein RSAG8_07295, partial [Rhizoctonia solani AG-8 WAC10335]